MTTVTVPNIPEAVKGLAIDAGCIPTLAIVESPPFHTETTTDCTPSGLG